MSVSKTLALRKQACTWQEDELSLALDALTLLKERGFAVIPGPIPAERMDSFANAYNDAVTSAAGSDVSTGRSNTSTRVTDFVNRGPLFDEVYVYPPLLAASRHVVGPSFKLSSLNARTLHPHSTAGELHVDVQRNTEDWPLLGFILMVDEFRPDNGATRFIPRSHEWLETPTDRISDLRAEDKRQVLACGPPGSLLVFSGSTWHSYTANESNSPRRSVQGAFIPRAGGAATDFAARMQPETAERLSSLARYVLGFARTMSLPSYS